ncbi:recombination-associated protein RdgC [Xenorhabdus sp. XENO-10]|uniref:Recombination-associated protein RdgC n=1 Tax=Xenorhabdus yunnanensis TaxID=3025878 RepID=A0ABT5LJT1_9GAMM|nr:recombination-associated protein RdgC [Xenorhabdus yunnanensis]MDC9590743.1 recombination-associated protein RdgC [Xenorhabdus yunnanensis]
MRKADLVYEDGKVHFNKEDIILTNDEAVSILLDQGRQVCTLGVHVKTQYGLDLELTNSCKFKRFQFGEAFLNQNDDIDSNEKSGNGLLAREYADFILMVDEFRAAYNTIFNAMGGLLNTGPGNEE